MSKSYRSSFALSPRQAQFLRQVAAYDRVRSLDAWFYSEALRAIGDLLADPETALEMGFRLEDWRDLVNSSDQRDHIIEMWDRYATYGTCLLPGVSFVEVAQNR